MSVKRVPSRNAMASCPSLDETRSIFTNRTRSGAPSAEVFAMVNASSSTAAVDAPSSALPTRVAVTATGPRAPSIMLENLSRGRRDNDTNNVGRCREVGEYRGGFVSGQLLDRVMARGDTDGLSADPAAALDVCRRVAD